MPRKSEIPKKIISYLKKNPTAKRDQIKEALGVSYQAVQKHLKNLEEDGAILPSFAITDKVAEKTHKFWVFIKTKYPYIEDEPAGESNYQRTLCEDIFNKFMGDSHLVKELIFGGIDIIVGSEYDIILSIYSVDADAVSIFVTRYLRPHPSVSSTSTAWSLLENSVENLSNNRVNRTGHHPT